MIKLIECNPFLRTAMVQSSVMEGNAPRKPYDNRIFFVYSGSADIILNGNTVGLRQSSLVFLTPRDEYYFKGKISAAVLNFDMTAAEVARKKPICPVPSAQYDEASVFDRSIVEGFSLPVVLNADETLKREIDELVSVFIRGDELFDVVCSALLKKLLTDISALRDQKSEHAMLAERLMQYVKSNATRIERSSELQNAFGYHHVYLADIFKKAFGKTLHAVILEEKLYVAARLLAYTNDSVEDIAFKTGFSGRSYFCTAFKKHFSISPIAYRNKHRITIT